MKTFILLKHQSFMYNPNKYRIHLNMFFFLVLLFFLMTRMFGDKSQATWDHNNTFDSPRGAILLQLRPHKLQSCDVSFYIPYNQLSYCKGCFSSNNPVPPFTSFPTTRQAEGETSWSCDPAKEWRKSNEENRHMGSFSSCLWKENIKSAPWALWWTLVDPLRV